MGYIPQSKLTVDLDQIYVKKPCIGTELSGKINIISNDIEIIKDTIDNIDNITDELIIDYCPIDENENSNSTFGLLKSKRDATPSEEDIKTLEKTIEKKRQKVQKRYETVGKFFNGVWDHYHEGRQLGINIRNPHEEYQSTITKLLSFLKKDPIYWDGAIAPTTVQKEGEHKYDCCEDSQSIWNSIKFDKRNTEKIASNNKTLNVNYRKIGETKQTVHFYLYNLGLLEGLNRTEETLIYDLLNGVFQSYLDALNTFNGILWRLPSPTAQNYYTVLQNYNDANNTFNDEVTNIIDDILNIENNKTYETELNNKKTEWNNLDDSEELERATEHVKHHKNGIKVTFYPNPADYIGRYTVNSNAKTYDDYFEPGKSPYSLKQGISEENCDFVVWRSNGEKLRDLISNAEITEQVQELTAYGDWKITYTISYTDDNGTDSSYCYLGSNQKDYIEYLVSKHYQNIENFVWNNVRITPNHDSLILLNNKDFSANYNYENICLLKVFNDYNGYTDYSTVANDASFVAVAVPKNTVVDQAMMTHIELYARLASNRASIQQTSLRIGDRIGTESTRDVLCEFKARGSIFFEYDDPTFIKSNGEPSKEKKTYDLRFAEYADYPNLCIMFRPKLTDNHIKTFIQQEYDSLNYNLFDLDNIEITASDNARNKKGDNIIVKLRLKTINVTVEIKNKETNSIEKTKTYSNLYVTGRSKVNIWNSLTSIGSDEYPFWDPEIDDYKYGKSEITDNDKDAIVISDTTIHVDWYPRKKLSFLDGFNNEVDAYYGYYGEMVDIDYIDRSQLAFWPEDFIIKNERIWYLDEKDPYSPTGTIELNTDLSVRPKYIESEQAYNKLSILIETGTFTPKDGESEPMPGQSERYDSGIEEIQLTVINHGQPTLKDSFDVPITYKTNVRKGTITQTIPGTSRELINQHESDFIENELKTRWRYWDRKTNNEYDVVSSKEIRLFSETNIDNLLTIPHCVFYPEVCEDSYNIKTLDNVYTYRHTYNTSSLKDHKIKSIIKSPYYKTAKNMQYYDMPDLTNIDFITIEGNKYFLNKEIPNELKTLGNGNNNILVAIGIPLSYIKGITTFHFANDFDFSGIEDQNDKYKNSKKIEQETDICDNPTIVKIEGEDYKFNVHCIECDIPSITVKNGYTIKLREGNNNKDGREIDISSKISRDVKLTFGTIIDTLGTRKYVRIDLQNENADYTFYISKNAATTQQEVRTGSDLGTIGNPTGTTVKAADGSDLAGPVEVGEGEDRQTKAKEAIRTSIQTGSGVLIKNGDLTMTIPPNQISIA